MSCLYNYQVEKDLGEIEEIEKDSQKNAYVRIVSVCVCVCVCAYLCRLYCCVWSYM